MVVTSHHVQRPDVSARGTVSATSSNTRAKAGDFLVQ